ncbi:hypothetical protein CUM72_01465 [Enterococcus durans]|nr:hypothetical protein CUM72_01465 [Enterococcus durans]TKN17424.1 hypothetical protein DVW83_08280 [Enterococcus sp. VV15]
MFWRNYPEVSVDNKSIFIILFSKKFTSFALSVDYFFYRCLFCVKRAWKMLWIIRVHNFFHIQNTLQKIVLWKNRIRILTRIVLFYIDKIP